MQAENEFMEKDIRIVKPGPDGALVGEHGDLLTPPADWAFLPAGDAAITRKVTAGGSYWKVEVKMGRRTISKGIWAPAVNISQAQKLVNAVRLTDAYQLKRHADIKRREKKQQLYEADFCRAVEDYLHFHPQYKSMELKLAKAITMHAIPVGSGTVARTQMIPVEERAAHAVVAWLRHQTTAYDQMHIARIKGERRAVRQTLARQSLSVLSRYRAGSVIPDDCPLKAALLKL